MGKCEGTRGFGIVFHVSSGGMRPPYTEASLYQCEPPRTVSAREVRRRIIATYSFRAFGGCDGWAPAGPEEDYHEVAYESGSRVGAAIGVNG